MNRAPWCSCKVAFDIRKPDRWERARDRKAFELPSGWECREFYETPIASMVIFEVEGVPTVEAGRAVAATIRRFGR